MQECLKGLEVLLASQLWQEQETRQQEVIILKDKFHQKADIPSLSEQEQIVERIETIFTSLDMIMESL